MTCPSEAITYRSAWGPLAYVSCDGVEIQMARLEPSGCGSTRDRMYPAGPVHNTFPLRQATTVTGWETFPPFVTASDPSQQNPSTRTLSWARRVPSALKIADPGLAWATLVSDMYSPSGEATT